MDQRGKRRENSKEVRNKLSVINENWTNKNLANYINTAGKKIQGKEWREELNMLNRPRELQAQHDYQFRNSTYRNHIKTNLKGVSI